MDVRTFANELLQALSAVGLFEQISLQSEGPTVSGYAYPQDSPYFLRFYYNEKTGTMAFALIENQQRIWGIDYDNRRGWHLHPVEQPTRHIPIGALSISKIVAQLQQVLEARS